MDEEKIENNIENKTMEIPQKFNNATQKYEPDLEALEKKVEEMKKEHNHSKEVEVREKEIKRQEELAKGVESKEPSSKDDTTVPSGEPKSIKDDKAGKKEGSFRPIIIIMVASLLIASMWDKLIGGKPIISDSVHFILDPSAGLALNWNLNWGMLIIVLVITILTTIVQKYATDQETLKELKKEQKEIQKQMKEFKKHPEKLMELQKKQFKLMPKQMKLSMRAIAYTGIPFILFFRWFGDYFTVAGNPKLWLGMSWFLFYILASIAMGAILRKKFDVV